MSRFALNLDDNDSEYVNAVFRGLGFDFYNQEWAGSVPYRGPCPEIDLFGRVGLHCYNLQKVKYLLVFVFCFFMKYCLCLILVCVPYNL